MHIHEESMKAETASLENANKELGWPLETLLLTPLPSSPTKNVCSSKLALTNMESDARRCSSAYSWKDRSHEHIHKVQNMSTMENSGMSSFNDTKVSSWIPLHRVEVPISCLEWDGEFILNPYQVVYGFVLEMVLD